MLPRADLVLRHLPLAGATPAEALDGLSRGLGQHVPILATDAAAAYTVERDFLDQHTLIPLLCLPRAWAVSGRLRDLHLTVQGIPDLAGVSLPVSIIEDAR